MKLSLALHLIGICLWLGSMIIGSRVLALLSETSNLPKKIPQSIMLFTVIGLAVSLATGIAQIVIQGPSFYFSQPWFHTKLTLVIVLLVISLIFIAHSKKVASGALAPKKGVLMMVHGVSSLMLIGIVLLTMLMR